MKLFCPKKFYSALLQPTLLFKGRVFLSQKNLLWALVNDVRTFFRNSSDERLAIIDAMSHIVKLHAPQSKAA
ncbi:hypothetical protein C4572_00075 [Candidatus Parcubacteria bacterium]|nr:MAG: hypothetical protein C4572_00075 [Candidatus Parcubacteria bacterium]